MKLSQELCREPKFIFSFLIAVSSDKLPYKTSNMGEYLSITLLEKMRSDDIK
jgi:hypothetical protein